MTPEEEEQRKHKQRALAMFKEHKDKIRSIVYRYVRNPADMDELASEVLLRFVSTVDFSSFATMKSWKGYLSSMARNVAMDFLRHKKVVPIDYVPEFDNLPVQDTEPDPADEVAMLQELQRLMEAVNGLPDKCRRIFVMRKVYGYSQKEIAQLLNISENTVEQHLSKGIRIVAISLEPDIGTSRMMEALRNYSNPHTRDDTNVVDFPIDPDQKAS